MRSVIVCLFVCVVLAVAVPPVMAQTTARYQAIQLPASRVGQQELPNVLILDVVEGHLWLWHQESTTVPSKSWEPVKVETFLNYQGRLRSGKKTGELIEKW